MTIIFGSEYQRGAELYRLVGLKKDKAVLRVTSRQRLIEVPKTEIDTVYISTGNHDHQNWCCSEHNIHVTPHHGCVLR